MNRPLSLSLAAMLGVSIAGCNEESIVKVRFLHASPDAPAVDITARGVKVVKDLNYREGTGYLPALKGNTAIEVRPAGTETAVISANVDLQKGVEYTIVALNNVASIEPLVIANDADSPAEGFIQLQVVHGAPSVPEVDIYITGADDDLTGATPTLAAVPFKAVSDELEVAAGNYRVRATLADDSNVVYDSGPIDIPAGSEIIAVATEVATGLSPIGLILMQEDKNSPVVALNDARARVRAVHASPDAPEVNVLVNDAVALSDVPFAVGSDYLTILSGETNLKVNAAASSATVIDADLSIDAGTDYTVAAVNFLASIEPLVLVDDNSQPAAGNIKLRLVHAAPSAGLVDIYITDGTDDISILDPAIQDFDFKADSGYLEVPAGSYRVLITVADTKTVAIDSGTVDLTAGQVRTAFALDPAPGSSDFGALLLADLN